MSQPQGNVLENTLNTGIVIAGAYADKVRRTLFAQLKDYTRGNKDLAREAARASAELNRLLYYVIVDELKGNKGDAVRIRVSYRVYLDKNLIEWDYNSLSVEFFRRVSDEEVSKVVSKVVNERLSEVKEAFGRRAVEAPPPAPESAGEAERAVEAREVKEEQAAQPSVEIAGIVLLGETAIGSTLLKIEDSRGNTVGIVELTDRDGKVSGEVLLVYDREGYRAIVAIEGRLSELLENTNRIIDELRKARYVQISREEAEAFIKEKMNLLS
ncbi:single- stranded DNA-binding family protein [Thermogladius sp. 4427co]|uniref:single- stranded DNA-binding family protein n=1 Tax=Thermogladius sp. 4427co TaxID=3450718 RepID=UPI003F7B195B